MKLKKQALLGATALGMLATAAQAEYPERPIKTVAFAAVQFPQY